MTLSAPRDFTKSRFAVLHTPVTSAPKYLASWTAAVPNDEWVGLSQTHVPGGNGGREDANQDLIVLGNRFLDLLDLKHFRWSVLFVYGCFHSSTPPRLTILFTNIGSSYSTYRGRETMRTVMPNTVKIRYPPSRALTLRQRQDNVPDPDPISAHY